MPSAHHWEIFPGHEVRSALREAVWEIPLPIVVLGGIYSGYFAISEAAAVTALYVLIVDVVILKEVYFAQTAFDRTRVR